MTRRDFLKAALGGTAAYAAARWALPAGAQVPVAPLPVGLARGDHLYLTLPNPYLVPQGVYPEGKLDWDVIDALVRHSSELAGVAQPWNLFGPSDRVAVMLDAAPPAVPLITVEAVLEQLVTAGVPPDRILLFSASERELFAGGFSLRSEGPGVRCLGADAVGYRGGLSRIVLDMCDKLVSLSVLRPHPQLGMSGALANVLNAWESTRRAAVLLKPDELGQLWTDRQVSGRIALHLVDCTHPFHRVPLPKETPAPRWEYRGFLCSRDPVAADVLGRRILEAQRAKLKGEADPLVPAPTYLEAAAQRYHLGEADPARAPLAFWGDPTDALVELPPPPPPPPAPATPAP